MGILRTIIYSCQRIDPLFLWCCFGVLVLLLMGDQPLYKKFLQRIKTRLRIPNVIAGFIFIIIGGIISYYFIEPETIKQAITCGLAVTSLGSIKGLNSE